MVLYRYVKVCKGRKEQWKMSTTMLNSYYSLSFSHERGISHASLAYTKFKLLLPTRGWKELLWQADSEKSTEIIINHRYN